MFDKMKDAYRFQQQARQIQKELKSMSFSASSSSGSVTVAVNGIQEVADIQLQLTADMIENPGRLQREIMDVTNKALQKAQKASAEKMKTIMGGTGLPGM